ncbi:MAG: DNA recombination protein RmuC [Fimbriimonadaceae bacterium]|nr:DNA recombination protein RmuC [Fimbriimonadaceae bacterium]QYK55728.1 MAG: DNA recombination protein RmuC [Fimbriimonadaceae bacterium]
MDIWIGILVLLLGGGVGAAAVFFLQKGPLAGLRLELEEQKRLAEEARAKLACEMAGHQETEKLVARLEERASRLDELAQQIGAKDSVIEDLRQTLSRYESLQAGIEARLEEREQAIQQQADLLCKAEEKLKDSFQALSGETLAKQTEELQKAAERLFAHYKESADGALGKRETAIDELLKPLRERLKDLDDHNRTMEQRRQGAYQELLQQVLPLEKQQAGLTKETSRLVKALQDPGSAGSWGEMVLERVVEMAGLEERTSFVTQLTFEGEDGKQRPDMVVRMPGNRALIVDSKAPMRSYIEALESNDENSRDILLRDHSKKLLDHANALRKKNYSKLLQESPDFIVLFVPSESAYRAALEYRPSLMEETMACNVILASPMSLLGLLRLVDHSWRQDKLAESARALQKDASELYSRLGSLVGHYNKLGSALNKAGTAFNELGGSLDKRVLPAARRFRDHGLPVPDQLEVDEPIAFGPRPLLGQEFQPALVSMEESAEGSRKQTELF